MLKLTRFKLSPFADFFWIVNEVLIQWDMTGQEKALPAYSLSQHTQPFNLWSSFLSNHRTFLHPPAGSDSAAPLATRNCPCWLWRKSPSCGATSSERDVLCWYCYYCSCIFNSVFMNNFVSFTTNFLLRCNFISSFSALRRHLRSFF